MTHVLILVYLWLIILPNLQSSIAHYDLQRVICIHVMDILLSIDILFISCVIISMGAKVCFDFMDNNEYVYKLAMICFIRFEIKDITVICTETIILMSKMYRKVGLLRLIHPLTIHQQHRNRHAIYQQPPRNNHSINNKQDRNLTSTRPKQDLNDTTTSYPQHTVLKLCRYCQYSLYSHVIDSLLNELIIIITEKIIDEIETLL